jgi:hypothetical protein
MRSRARVFIVICFAVLASIGSGSYVGGAQEPPGTLGSYFPTQLIPGETTVLYVSTAARSPIESIEIAPSAGISVTGMKRRDNNQGGIWYEFTVAVAKDAAPGTRMLVGVQRTGRTAPVMLLIPPHVPSISGLRILPAETNRPTVELQFAAVGSGGTFDESPQVWFVLDCGPSQREFGVVRGRFANGVIRVNIPRVTRTGTQDPAASCNLDVRATDSSGIDSNTLRTAVDIK